MLASRWEMGQGGARAVGAIALVVIAAMVSAVPCVVFSCFVEEQCAGDAECGGGQICVDATCQSGCRLARDCPAGQSCIANRCQNPGVADAAVDADAEGDCAVVCPEDMAPVCSFCVDIYEASRQDATEAWAGADDASSALSRPGVLPWTNVSPETARGACERAGKRLCTHLEWIDACRGPSDTDYPYGNTYEPETCNGIDTFGRGNQRLLPTASFPDCINGFGVHDISGNVWEIDEDVPGWVHGGAYNCIDSRSLHLCSYNQDFGTDPRSNVGFRCCGDGL